MNHRNEAIHRITPEIARKVGPIFPGSISIPAYQRKKLKANDREVPESVSGWIFFDTTSRHSLVASTVILDRLNLFPSGLGGDTVFHYVFIAEIELFGNLSPSPGAWIMPVKASGAPYPFDHKPEEQVIAHLGTDFLDKVEFSYNGPEGIVSLKIDPARLIF